MASRFILLTLSGNATLPNTVRCGQIAYDWKTIPRFRSSAARSTFPARSKKIRSPQEIVPWSGRWKPAIDISVVVFPHPLGPSRVRNSLSRTVKLTSLSARPWARPWARPSARPCPWPKALLRPATVMSGMTVSSGPDREQPASGRDGDHRDRDLHHGQRRDRPGRTLPQGVQHRDAHDLVAGSGEEQGRVVVVQDRDEQQYERREQRGPQYREGDPGHRRPPARAAGASRMVQRLADRREGGGHHEIRDRERADAERQHDPPDAVPQRAPRGIDQQEGPEEPDPDDDPGDGPGEQHDEGKGTAQPESRTVRHGRGERDDRAGENGADGGDLDGVQDRVGQGALADRPPVAEREQVPRSDQRRQLGDQRGQRERRDRSERRGRQVQPEQRAQHPPGPGPQPHADLRRGAASP